MRRFVIFQGWHLFSRQKTFHVSVDLGQVRVQSPDFFLLSEKNFVHLLLIMLQVHQRFLHGQPLRLQSGKLIRRC